MANKIIIKKITKTFSDDTCEIYTKYLKCKFNYLVYSKDNIDDDDLDILELRATSNYILNNVLVKLKEWYKPIYDIHINFNETYQYSCEDNILNINELYGITLNISDIHRAVLIEIYINFDKPRISSHKELDINLKYLNKLLSMFINEKNEFIINNKKKLSLFKIN